MPLLKAGPLSDLPVGAMKEIELGEVTYAVCNIDGKLHCIEGTCPHAGGPLGQGTLSGNYVICPWHGFEFDCRTGLNEYEEDLRVETFPVMVQDDEILIDVP